MRDDQIIEVAVSRCGTVRSLARTLGVKPMTAYQWRNRRSIPAGWRAYLLEKLADPRWPVSGAVATQQHAEAA